MAYQYFLISSTFPNNSNICDFLNIKVETAGYNKIDYIINYYINTYNNLNGSKHLGKYYDFAGNNLNNIKYTAKYYDFAADLKIYYNKICDIKIKEDIFDMDRILHTIGSDKKESGPKI